MLVYIGIAAVCAALSVLFFSGKGTFLVRAAAKGEDIEVFYNEKRLRWVCGGGMGLLTVLFGVLTPFAEKLPFWLPMAIAAGICIVLMLLCNTVCALPQPEPWYRRTAGMFFLGLCVVLVFALSLFGKGSEIAVTTDTDSFTVHGSLGIVQTVSYADVRSITLETGWENGTRLRGTVGTRFCEGRFRNEQIGAYTQYAYTPCDARVVVRTDTQTLVLGAPTAQETKELYTMLSERVNPHAAQ